MDDLIRALREATEGTEYENRLYLVGGVVRDAVLGIEPEEDVDLVLEGDAGELAHFLLRRGVGSHPPVVFPRFGTAMLTVDGHQVEIVGARKESYDRTSRKPSTVPGTLLDDVLRRDFTINTLLQNLHTDEILDLTGRALSDIQAGLIRTPREPTATFDDDPLRMMRAVRFASRLGFSIDADTYQAIRDCSQRLAIVSAERIREEFTKIVMSDGARRGLEMLRETGLLGKFAPELPVTHGVTQNIYHIDDVWTHTLKTLESIPAEQGITLKLAALLHDVGKPPTRSVDEQGGVHFYGHQKIGAEIARRILHRMRFPNSQVDEIAFLISMHLRVGEYDSGWSDAAVRRLIRDAGKHLDKLIVLTRADKGAANPDMPSVDIDALERHIDKIRSELAGQRIASPLDGKEIIELLGIAPGPEIGRAKEFLESRVIEGWLLPGDKSAAAELLRKEYDARRNGN